MSRNHQLEVENNRLSMKVEEMKEICTQTSSINVKYKMQLEREKESKEELVEGNSRLKKKCNELATRCHEQNEKIKVLESNLRRCTLASIRASRIPVKIIGNVSQIIQKSDPKTSSEYIDLQQKHDELENDYQEALVVIDELEFELDDVSMSGLISLFTLLARVQKCATAVTDFLSSFIVLCLFASLLIVPTHYIQFSIHLWRATTTPIRLITSRWKYNAWHKRMLNCENNWREMITSKMKAMREVRKVNELNCQWSLPQTANPSHHSMSLGQGWLSS